MIKNSNKHFFKRSITFLIILTLLAVMHPAGIVTYASTDPVKDAKMQIATLIKSLLKQHNAKASVVITDDDKMYKEIKLNGTARIIYKNGKFQLDDVKKLSSGESDTNYYFLDFKNYIVTDPYTIAKFETIHVANKYFTKYKYQGDSIDTSFLLWKTNKVYLGEDLMEQQYKEIDNEKDILKNEGFYDGLMNIGSLYQGAAISLPYNYLFHGETFSIKTINKNFIQSIGVKAFVGYILKNFSPYPNYTFKDFLNSAYYTWYNQLDAEKEKIKELFKKEYIGNYSDASIFLTHINTVYTLTGTYPFILNYINGKVVEDKNTWDSICTFAKEFVKRPVVNPVDTNSGGMDVLELLTGWNDSDELFANDDLSVYIRNAYDNKEDIFEAVSVYNNEAVSNWGKLVKTFENIPEKMINDSIKYGQTGYIVTCINNILVKKAKAVLVNGLAKNGISAATDKNMKIEFEEIEKAQNEKSYYKFHVYDDMKDHTSTIARYGVQVDGTGLYDFTLCREIDASSLGRIGILGKNIKIGLFYDSVISILGKPKSSTIESASGYLPFAYTMTLKYDFGELYLGSFYYKDTKWFILTDIIINKKGFDGAFGIQVGDTYKEVVKRMEANSENYRIYPNDDYTSYGFYNEDSAGGYFADISKPADTYLGFQLEYDKNYIVTSIRIFYSRWG
jgi:hypothetical protein